LAGSAVNSEIEEGNSASRSWLAGILTRLSEDDMKRRIGEDWTVSALLAHLAFWDRFCRARWLHAQRTGATTPGPLDDALLELINDADLSHWAVIPPRIAAEECLEAAERIDALVGSLDDEVARKIEAEGRRRLIDRSIHRREHLSSIDAAFPTGA
jgi:hypothetical protein